MEQNETFVNTTPQAQVLKLFNESHSRGPVDAGFVIDSNRKTRTFAQKYLEVIQPMVGNVDVESIDGLVELLGDSVTFKDTVTQKAGNPEGIPNVVSAEKLIDITVVSDEDSPLYPAKNIPESVLRSWKEEYPGSVFGARENGRHVVTSKVQKEAPTKEILEELQHSLPQALSPMLVRLGRVMDQDGLDSEVKKTARGHFYAVSKTIEKSSKSPLDVRLIKIILILGPYLGEVETEEDNTKFEFLSDMSEADFMKAVDLCRDVSRKRKK